MVLIISICLADGSVMRHFGEEPVWNDEFTYVKFEDGMALELQEDGEWEEIR